MFRLTKLILFLSFSSIYSIVAQQNPLSLLEELLENRQYDQLIQTVENWKIADPPIDTLSLSYAKVAKIEAEAYGWLNKFDISIRKLEHAIVLLERHPDTEELIAEVIDGIMTAYLYAGQFENAKAASNRLINYSTTYLNNSVDHAAYMVRSSYPYFNFDRPETGDSLVSIGLKIFASIGEEMHPDINMAYNCKGIYHKNRGQYAEAAQWYGKAKNVLAHNDLIESQDYVTMLINMANVLRRNNDLDEAIVALKQALDINERHHGVGTLENEMVYTGLSNCYILKEDYDTGLYYGQLSLSFSEALYGRESAFYIENELAYRENLLIAGRNEEAMKGHEDMGNRTVAIFGDQAETYAYYLRQVGKGLKNIGKYDEAIAQLLYSLTSFGIDPNNIQETFKIKDPSGYMAVMREITDTYYRKWQSDRDIKNLINGEKFAELGIATIQEFRKQSTLTNSKLLFTASQSEFIGQAISLQYELYNATNEWSYLDKALKYIELSKNIRFTENLKSRDILKSSSIPRSELEKAQDLRRQIIEIEESLNEITVDSLMILAQNKLHVLHDQETDWFTSMSLLYPEFKNQRYGNWEKSIQDIRDQHLRPNELILDYMLSDTVYYVIGISHHQLSFRKFSTSEIEDYKLSDPKISLSNGQLKALSTALLIPELQHHQDISTISIMPSGRITFIPFEALLSDEGKLIVESYTLRQLINFEFSTGRDHPQAGLLAIAPAYTEEWIENEDNQIIAALVRSGQWKLPGAQIESKKITDLMHGKLLKGKDATKTTFINMASKYGVIHLSMHTVPAEEVMSSALVFNSDQASTRYDYLTLDEIYNLDLNAELVTLSACNTGVGAFQKGEGILSLAHAFGIAGVPATVMSLWKVPDESTSKIMISFYEYLKEGQPKDQALRNAKLKYLSNTISTKQKDPFYWAGFVIVGDVSPLDKTSQGVGTIWVMIGLLLTLLLAYYYYTHRI